MQVHEINILNYCRQLKKDERRELIRKKEMEYDEQVYEDIKGSMIFSQQIDDSFLKGFIAFCKMTPDKMISDIGHIKAAERIFNSALRASSYMFSEPRVSFIEGVYEYSIFGEDSFNYFNNKILNAKDPLFSKTPIEVNGNFKESQYQLNESIILRHKQQLDTINNFNERIRVQNRLLWLGPASLNTKV